MTNSWEKVLNILTVIAILICIVEGIQGCLPDYLDYLETVGGNGRTALTFHQMMCTSRFYRQALFQCTETLLWIALVILVSRLAYLRLNRLIPLWEKENQQEAVNEDEAPNADRPQGKR